VLRAVHPLEHVTVDVLPRKTHLHPGSWHCGVRHLGGDQVVEGPVKMREWHIDEHARDGGYIGRVDRLLGLGLRRGSLSRVASACASQLGHQRQLTRLVVALVLVHALSLTSRHLPGP
jgi:hypothetical protein